MCRACCRLFLTWYNPVTEDDSKLRHILGTFFPLYASMSRANQDCIEEALLPTLRDNIQCSNENSTSAFLDMFKYSQSFPSHYL